MPFIPYICPDCGKEFEVYADYVLRGVEGAIPKSDGSVVIFADPTAMHRCDTCREIKLIDMFCENVSRNVRRRIPMPKTNILKVKGDWQEVVDDCRATVAKPPLGKEPSDKFKQDILIAEHDPIRDIEVKFSWRNIPYWVAMHWKTHIWRSRTNTQRNDRQSNYDRNKAPQDAPVDFTGDANVQHQIDTWRKRLCRMAAPETRELAEDFKMELHGVEPQISNVLVPNCIYRCGCPEPISCGWYDRMMKKYPQYAEHLRSTDIRIRYAAYNLIFWEEKGRSMEDIYDT